MKNANPNLIAISAVLLMGMPLGTFFYLRHKAKQNAATQEEHEALETLSPEWFASKLKYELYDQFSWLSWDWNVDEEAVYALLRKIPSQTFAQKVSKSLHKLTNNTLNEALLRLGSDDVKIAQHILDSKPEK